MTYAVVRKGSGLKRSGKPLVAVGKPIESLGVEVAGETVRIVAGPGTRATVVVGERHLQV